ncbi:DUF2378 family protein [Pyxidicoccus parkwayensis]|uniref:DUF2378 family protein n=1 Tax=Pyxidicoccus parkwayensis TaxID=2813578 RepID=A0ABX7NQU1_9BACT|nr:DUF2378 family protein [Pyxidicoccus parkwaysis]QSQ20766.1 DUF2378 family protein [Pyxidicoccus parkwaysis]
MKLRKPVPLEQRLVYVQVVEGLLQHGLNGRVTPRLKQRLRQVGVDLDRPLLPAYPVPLWTHCLSIIVDEAYPGIPREEAFRRLAETHVQGYGRTVIGRAVFGVMRLLGPRRLVLRIPQTLRATDNYTEVELLERGPTTYEMKMNSVVEPPGYVESLFESLLRVGGAESPKVSRIHVDPGTPSTTYQLTWAER